jgi:Rho termination factor, N-terminal domain
VKRIATLIALAAGGWVLARKLLGWQDHDQPLSEGVPAGPPSGAGEPISGSGEPTPPAAPVSGAREPLPGDAEGIPGDAAGTQDDAAGIPADAAGIPGDAGGTPDAATPIQGGVERDGFAAPASASKADLYEQAKRLGIEGRSKMSRDELAEAISRAGNA